jgi:hypothetical protein
MWLRALLIGNIHKPHFKVAMDDDFNVPEAMAALF